MTSFEQVGSTGFRELLDAAPDAIVVVDGDGRVVFVNRQTERLFGYAREELLLQSIEVLVPDRFRRRHVNQRADYFAAPMVRPMAAGLELYGLRKNSSEFAAEISLSPIDAGVSSSGGSLGRMAIATIRDVSERKRLEQLRRDRETALERVQASMAARAAEGERCIQRWRELELDPVRRRVSIARAELVLRPLEFRLAATFLENRGRAFTRAELLQIVWGARHDHKTRTVDTHVRRLRERLGAYGEAIETMHGLGYRWRLED